MDTSCSFGVTSQPRAAAQNRASRPGSAASMTRCTRRVGTPTACHRRGTSRQASRRKRSTAWRAIVDFPVPGAPETTMRVKPQRAAISYGRGCRVSHCQNVRYGGRATKWPLPTLPETSIRSTSGTS